MRALITAFIVALTFVADVHAQGKLTVSWNANPEPDVAGYTVLVGTTPGQYATAIDVGKVTSYVFTEPDSTVPYYFVVRAYDAGGAWLGLVSPFSAEVASVPLSSVPTCADGAMLYPAGKDLVRSRVLNASVSSTITSFKAAGWTWIATRTVSTSTSDIFFRCR